MGFGQEHPPASLHLTINEWVLKPTKEGIVETYDARIGAFFTSIDASFSSVRKRILSKHGFIHMSQQLQSIGLSHNLLVFTSATAQYSYSSRSKIQTC